MKFTQHTGLKNNPQSMAVLARVPLQRKCSCGNQSPGGGECGACAKKKNGLQNSLYVGASHDPLEKQADLVAEQLTAASARPSVGDALPRIQRATGHASGKVSAAPASVDRALAGSGHSMEPQLQQDMGQRFGHDFSHIRLHTGADAAQSAREVNANAYTVGNNIVFAAGRFAPGTRTGQKLLAHELTHVIQQGAVNSEGRLHRSVLQRDPAPTPSSENVWGFRVTRSMCGCRDHVREDINWTNTAAATYAACDIPANATGVDVEACFDAAHPTSTVVASTSPSGEITMPAASNDPCERIEDKGTFVHETMHSRHTDDMARAQGSAFFREWRRLRGDPNRLDTLRASFPAQVAAFEAQWDDGHDWAQDEVNSYTWERRFLQDALRALNRIC